MEIRSTTIAEAWEKSILAILHCYNATGDTVITERDTTSIEIENMVMHIERPLQEPRRSFFHPNPEYLETYLNNTLDFKYQHDVHSRMLCTEYADTNINQLVEAVQRLKNNWYSSKAVITVWDPYVDLSSNHPPCTCLVQLYIRRNKLNMTSYFRSNDAWLCSLGDMIALTNLQNQISNELGIEVGTYTHIACFYHIYEYDIFAAANKFSKYK